MPIMPNMLRPTRGGFVPASQSDSQRAEIDALMASSRDPNARIPTNFGYVQGGHRYNPDGSFYDRGPLIRGSVGEIVSDPLSAAALAFGGPGAFGTGAATGSINAGLGNSFTEGFQSGAEGYTGANIVGGAILGTAALPQLAAAGGLTGGLGFFGDAIDGLQNVRDEWENLTGIDLPNLNDIDFPDFGGGGGGNGRPGGGSGGGGGGGGGFGDLGLASLLSPLLNAAAAYYGGRGQEDAYRAAAEAADPFRQYRPAFAQRLEELYSDPNAILNNPAYKFRMEQGMNAINANRAAQGMFDSGGTALELQKYGQGMASQEWENEVGRLARLSGADAVGGGADELARSMMAGDAARIGGITQLIGGIGGLFGGSGGGGGGGPQGIPYNDFSMPAGIPLPSFEDFDPVDLLSGSSSNYWNPSFDLSGSGYDLSQGGGSSGNIFLEGLEYY